MIKSPKRSLLILVSAPSGAGKTTLCERLLASDKNIFYSVSSTTRPPRKGEINGKDYHFIDEESFKDMAGRGEFLERALVHGHWYGTARSRILEALAKGMDVLMDVDVQGAAMLREYIMNASSGDPIKKGLVDIFIAPPSLDVLRQRIVGRGKDVEDVIAERMSNAQSEIECWKSYKYLIINDHLETSFTLLQSILCAEHLRILPACN